MDQVQSALKDYLIAKLLPGADPEELAVNTPLISTGILDSLATTQLVAYMEGRFGVVVEPHEHDADYLDTLERMAELIRSKRRV